jgi:copper(I)-binding protein
MRAIVGLCAAALLAACQQAPAEPSVEGAWVRLPAVQGNPGAAYFTLKGGREAEALVAASSPAAVRAELHESMEHGGMMSMAPVKSVALPAGGEIAFAPGGKHVMLYDIAPSVQPGETMPLVLSLADGSKLETQAKVVAAGQPAPAP